MLKGGHFYLKEQHNTKVLAQYIANFAEDCPV